MINAHVGQAITIGMCRVGKAKRARCCSRWPRVGTALRAVALQLWCHLSLLALRHVGIFAQSPPSPPAPQAPAPSQPRQHVTIGFVEIAGDPRHEPVRAYERLILKMREHPFTGAQIGVDEAAALMRVLNTEFSLERIPSSRPPR